MKILIEKQKGKKFLVREGQDFHSEYGTIKKEDYSKEVIDTNMKRRFFVVESSFIDIYRRIKRKAQLAPIEILGRIAADTGLGKESIIVDAGTGSGGACCYFAHLCKQVHTFDVEDEHINISKDNAKFLGIENISFNKTDIINDGFKDIQDNSVDLVFLDLLAPWLCLREAHRVLKRGGFLAVYNTQITQTINLRKEFDLMNEQKDSFVDFKTLEMIERLWNIDEERARPRFTSIGHSGFITFTRKV